MRYFEPELCPASIFTGSVIGTDKFGGYPWGFPKDKWPYCANCGRPMSHVCQLQHHEQRLDLGKHGRVLYAFQCENSTSSCQSWNKESGANRVYILEEVELNTEVNKLIDRSVTLFFESVVMSWHEGKDSVPPELDSRFYDDKLLMELPENIYEAPKRITRLGGVPSWIQNADEAPKYPWQFVMQMTDHYAFDMPISDELLGSAKVSYRDGRWYVNGPNFGTGLAYVFVNTSEDTPHALMLSQS